MRLPNTFHKKRKAVTLGFDMVYWIIRIIFFTVVVVTMIFLIRMLQVDTVNVDSLQNYVLQNRLLYAYDGISYFDVDSNRVYPGIINPDTLNEQVQRSIDFGSYKNYVAIRFDLVFGDKTAKYFFNEERYSLLEPLVGIYGPGGAKKSVRMDNVLVCSKNCLTEPENLKKGKLVITILRPNS